MKKLVSLLIALMMMVSVCCAEDTDEQIVLGIYDLVAIMEDGKFIAEEDTPMVTVFFYNDFTVTIYMNEDDVITGTYDASDEHDGFVVTTESGVFDFVLDPEANVMYLTDAESKRQATFALHIDTPAIINAESMNDFQGVWHVNAAVEMNIMVDLTDDDDSKIALFGSADPVIVIEGNHVNVLDGKMEGTAEFIDGSLSVATDNGAFSIEMTEDGGIACAAPDDYELVSVLFAVK